MRRVLVVWTKYWRHTAICRMVPVTPAQRPATAQLQIHCHSHQIPLYCPMEVLHPYQRPHRGQSLSHWERIYMLLVSVALVAHVKAIQ